MKNKAGTDMNENLGEQHNDFCYLGGKWNKLQMFLLYKCYYAFCQFYYLIVVRDRKLAKCHENWSQSKSLEIESHYISK